MVKFILCEFHDRISGVHKDFDCIGTLYLTNLGNIRLC